MKRAQVAKDILELLRKPGGTKNFAVIQGYIPKKMEKKFKDITRKMDVCRRRCLQILN